MKNKSLKTIIAALSITMIAGILGGCGTKDNTTTPQSTVNYSGSITAAGSTALQPLADAAGKNFQLKYPNANILVQGGGSGTGLKLVSEGTADIGDSDIFAEKSLTADIASQLVDHKVCVSGFAVVVNKEVNVNSLTSQQIQDIFTGKITNWKQVGGNDLAIQVINRTKSSGTRATFIATVMGGVTEKEGLGTTQDANGSVRTALIGTKGAISYLALSYLQGDVVNDLKIINIDNVAPTKDSITSGKYKFWSYEHMYTKGEAKDLTKGFIDYMTSSDNKALIEKLGYIPMGDMKVK